LRQSFSAAAVVLTGAALLLAGPAVAAAPVSGGNDIVADVTLAGTWALMILGVAGIGWSLRDGRSGARAS
jgi:hypothetical protein